jgi:hypothetical protein
MATSADLREEWREVRVNKAKCYLHYAADYVA